MIREFKPEDLDSFHPNQYSDFSSVFNVFFDDSFFKYSLIDKDIKAIMCVKNYRKNKWAGGIFYAEDIKPVHVKKIKRFLNERIQEVKPEKLFTISLDNELINRLHRFLGMVKKKTFLRNDARYTLWASYGT